MDIKCCRLCVHEGDDKYCGFCIHGEHPYSDNNIFLFNHFLDKGDEIKDEGEN